MQIRILMRVKCRILIRIRNKVKRKIQIIINVKIKELRRLQMERWRTANACNGGVNPQNGAGRVCRPMSSELHHFDEEQDSDPDPEPHQSKKLDPNQCEKKDADLQHRFI